MNFPRRAIVGGIAGGIAGGIRKQAQADQSPSPKVKSPPLSTRELVPDNDQSESATATYDPTSGQKHREKYPEHLGQNAYKNIEPPTPREEWEGPIKNVHEKQGPVDDLADGIHRAYFATGIDPALLAAIHAQESNNTYAISEMTSGAPNIGGKNQWFGPFQLSEIAFHDIYGDKPSKWPIEMPNNNVGSFLLHDGQSAAIAAARYLQKIHSNYSDRFAHLGKRDRVLATIAMYNGGPNIDPDNVQTYVNNVIRYYEKHGGKNIEDAIPYRDWSNRHVEPTLKRSLKINGFSLKKSLLFPFAMWPNR
jgi:hypothetical protein